MEDPNTRRESREVSENSFIMNDREHGLPGFGRHRREVSEFTNLSAHRVGGGADLNRVSVGSPCGCEAPERAELAPVLAVQGLLESTSTPCDDGCGHESSRAPALAGFLPSRDPRRELDDAGRPIPVELPSTAVPRPTGRETCDCARSQPSCGNAQFERELPFDPRTLGAIGGMRHEVGFDDDDDDCSTSRDAPRPRRLKVLDDLQLVCGNGTGTDAPVRTWTRNPLEGHTPSHVPPPRAQLTPQLVSDNGHSSGWAYRYSSGGACSGITQVSHAFNLAYQVLQSAEFEVLHYLQEHGQDEGTLKWLWGHAATKERATLRYWFGHEDSRWFHSRLATVASTLASWSWRFRHGFYDFHKPVWVRCYPHSYPGDAFAYHAEPNVVTLLGRWFDILDDPKSSRTLDLRQCIQATILLHEMGHYSGGPVPTTPNFWLNAWSGLIGSIQDRRNSACSGGSSDKCYAPVSPGEDLIFGGGDPRRLVDKFDKGNNDAGKDMLDNIDNYVSYMWNRWQDHGYDRYT